MTAGIRCWQICTPRTTKGQDRVLKAALHATYIQKSNRLAKRLFNGSRHRYAEDELDFGVYRPIW